MDPTRLSSGQLRDVVVAALVDGGMRVLSLEGDQSPFTLEVEDLANRERTRLRVYIRNITHGGATRAEDEYRIQITDPEIAVDEQHLTFLLGHHAATGVVAAFDPLAHQDYGASPSVQIPYGEMTEAAVGGVVRTFRRPRRGGDEPVVVFPEEFLADHVRARARLRADGADLVSTDETEAVLSGQLDTATDHQESYPPRERALLQTSRFVRTRLFALRVLRAYGRRCAFCGLNARLADAAHIVPVSQDGVDSVRNGLALCPTHHRAFDEGILSVSDGYAITFDESAFTARGGTDDDRQLLMAGVGAQIRLPEDVSMHPSPDWLRERNG
jgi:putative restriction endonuclease